MTEHQFSTDEQVKEFVEQYDLWFLTKMWLCSVLSGLGSSATYALKHQMMHAEDDSKY